MSNLHETDIVNSATPLEINFVGVHPRLYLTAKGIAELNGCLGREPWVGFLQRTLVQADAMINAGPPTTCESDVRGFGCGLANVAVACKLTGKPEYLNTAKRLLTAMCSIEHWGHSLNFGHWAHGVALAYDWLHHDLDEPHRQRVRETLLDRVMHVYRHWIDYADAYPNGFAWNHTCVVHAGMFSAGCAIWGDIDGAGRILRMTQEKLRLMVGALGSDGASAEGLAYGQYHQDFLLKSMVLADQLLGENHFADCEFLRSYTRFITQCALPRAGWNGQKIFMQFGDNDGPHWYGPDTHLRLIAQRYRDERAQWFADVVSATPGASGESSAYFNLLFYDPSVPRRPHDDLPTFHHLTDKDIVFMRSGWHDRAALLGIHCGPSQGHHAARKFRNNVAGGHMHPEAGSVLLHAGGEWLITDAGYTKKFTAYRNTLLVNGIGQTGEGATWFEDLEMRRGKPEGHIRHVHHGDLWDCVIADAGNAYERAARLRQFLRHVLFVKPDAWLIVDEVEAEVDSMFDLRFHGVNAFRTTGNVANAAHAAWVSRNNRMSVALTSLGPTPCAVRAFISPVLGAHAHNHPDREQQTLAISNATPTRAALFITVIHPYLSDAGPRVRPSLGGEPDRPWVDLQSDAARARVQLTPRQQDPSTPIFTIELR
ncbi:MAG: heparinase II/III family protein [Planctomycetota bacterium]|nr:heparinase II/III family protein [Planctomycetota bacterium]